MKPFRTWGAMFKTEKLNMEKVRIGLQQDHASFQTSLTLQITKLQDDLAVESKVMDALARKIEKVKELDTKLQKSKKRVQDLLSEKQCELALLMSPVCSLISLRPRTQ
ncbi:unnamed protein product [Lactuca saligna]|uniref:Uncharacterized protein n=1 Tax=Lactuca saligna TaxID=75948 RepID=A0AA36E278_LACSI|nr:unnamed protein product [Lactuca saligna]